MDSQQPLGFLKHGPGGNKDITIINSQFWHSINQHLPAYLQ